jgi:hypothetical protein
LLPTFLFTLSFSIFHSFHCLYCNNVCVSHALYYFMYFSPFATLYCLHAIQILRISNSTPTSIRFARIFRFLPS